MQFDWVIVWLGGQVIVGASWSLTITLNEQLAVLPDASVAVQVTLFVPLANVDPLAGTHALVTPGQLSLAEGANATAREHWPGAVFVVISTGQLMVGFSLSLTVTVKEQFAVLPEASVAVQLTVFVPLLKLLPDAGVHVMVTPGQLSLDVGE